MVIWKGNLWLSQELHTFLPPVFTWHFLFSRDRVSQLRSLSFDCGSIHTRHFLSPERLVSPFVPLPAGRKGTVVNLTNLFPWKRKSRKSSVTFFCDYIFDLKGQMVIFWILIFQMVFSPFLRAGVGIKHDFLLRQPFRWTQTILLFSLCPR